VTAYIGFDRSPEELGITNATTFISTAKDSEREYELTKVLGMTDESMMLMTCYSAMDPSFSPPGTTVAALITLQYGEPWLELAPGDYAREKYRAAEGLLDRAEMLYPGLRGHIEEMEISTPITHMRYLGHPGGAFYGFDQHVRDSDLLGSPQPPIEGLHLAGTWVTMGGFHPTLDFGARTARQVLKGLKS
jgi:prolycopene isomerase